MDGCWSAESRRSLAHARSQGAGNRARRPASMATTGSKRHAREAAATEIVWLRSMAAERNEDGKIEWQGKMVNLHYFYFR
jgi:hypothetical protein